MARRRKLRGPFESRACLKALCGRPGMLPNELQILRPQKVGLRTRGHFGPLRGEIWGPQKVGPGTLNRILKSSPLASVKPNPFGIATFKGSLPGKGVEDLLTMPLLMFGLVGIWPLSKGKKPDSLKAS